MNRPSPRTRRRFGFTLVELLVVILIIAILVALLVPAIAAAVRTAKDAAVSTEINNLAQALADFKTKYGEYPPSRILLSEDTVNYPFPVGSTIALSAVGSNQWYNPTNGPPPAFSPADMTLGALAQRSVAALRKFFPRAKLDPGTDAQGNFRWCDYNGNARFNGRPDPGYILLEGHECLVFFLGGIPTITPSSTPGAPPSYGMTGFCKDPLYPFRPEGDPNDPQIAPVLRPMFSLSRNTPSYEFRSDRLLDDEFDGMPGYVDSLGTLTDARFYAYFASYGGSYDPNDVNIFVNGANILSLFDASSQAPNANNQSVPVDTILRAYGPPNSSGFVASPGPNPYTNSPPQVGTARTFQNRDSFQIISAGRDRVYGPAGEYQAGNTTQKLPFDQGIGTTSTAIRDYEQDNLTNFTTGKLD